MQCTRCRRINTLDAHFCSECGSPLAQRVAPYPRLPHEPGSFTPVRPMAPDEQLAARGSRPSAEYSQHATATTAPAAPPAPSRPRVDGPAAAAPNTPIAELHPSPPASAGLAEHEPINPSRQALRGAPPRRGRSRLLLGLAAFALIAAALGAAAYWYVLPRNNGSVSSPATSTPTATPTTSEASVSPSPSEPSRSATPAPTGPPQPDEVAALVTSYFEDAPSDPSASWELLGPQAQTQSRNLTDFAQWWQTVESSSAQLKDWNQATQIATVGLNLVMKDASTTASTVRLGVIRDDSGDLRISALNQ